MGNDLISWEYGTWLGLTAKLPLPIGACLSTLRGAINAARDRDWRSLTLGQPYVRERTALALKELEVIRTLRDGYDRSGGRSARSIKQGTRERFIYSAFEEWQAALIQNDRVKKLSFEGEAHHKKLPRQAIIATMHVDSPMLGLVQLGRWGRPLCALSSDIVEDPRVHPAIQEFFKAKYSAMATHWHGGRCMHKERELSPFIRAAVDGQSLAIFCDVPGKSGHAKGYLAPFLGANRLMAPVLHRVAKRLDLPVVGMLCRRLSASKYRVEFSQPCHPNEAADWLFPIYQFWSDKISENPSSWWASDLLCDLPGQ